MLLFNGRVHIQTGNITLLHTDAIVNITNASLLLAEENRLFSQKGMDSFLNHIPKEGE